jgi:hypothetical protein
VFEKAGHEGGGYGWEAIAKLVVEDLAGLAERLSFDPESSMFCAYGTDKPALEQLGAALALDARRRRASTTKLEFRAHR